MIRYLYKIISAAFFVFAVSMLFNTAVLAQKTTPLPADSTSNSSATSTTSPPITDQSIADSVCQGVLGTQDPNVNTNVTVSDCREDSSETFSAVMRRVINVFSILVGAVSVIMIIVGGFRYIISGGDSAGVSGAKNTILYAIVGLVIVLFAQVIVRFIIANLSTAPVTQTPTTSETQTK
jgi:hypothetical protein